MAGLQLHFPNHRPIFSERMGIKKPIFKLLGFRLFVLGGTTSPKVTV